MKAKLTVIIPCKNERLNIRPCIESVRSLADEILVADSGSTDGTLDIVRSLGGCHIVQREYINSGNFKNWAIPQAVHPWVLIVDADERVPPALAAEIRGLLAGAPRHDGFQLYRNNYFLGRRVRFGGFGGDSVLRLFRRDLGRYQGESDHAEVGISSGKVGRVRTPLEHYSYWSYDQYYRKFHRYTVQRAEYWHGHGRPVSLSRLLLAGPLRFLNCYLLRLGFLDGLAGIQVCALTGWSSFMKQARLWELTHGIPQPDPEAAVDAEQAGQVESEAVAA